MDLSLLYNIVFTATLVVLYYTLYRIHIEVWRSSRNFHEQLCAQSFLFPSPSSLQFVCPSRSPQPCGRSRSAVLLFSVTKVLVHYRFEQNLRSAGRCRPALLRYRPRLSTSRTTLTRWGLLSLTSRAESGHNTLALSRFQRRFFGIAQRSPVLYLR
jgi:hypothetical protein